MIAVVVLRMVSYAMLGALIGAGHFAALEWNVRLYIGRVAGWKAALLHFSRLAVAMAAFTLCARQGAAALLASFAGFLAIRTTSVNRYRFVLARNS